MDYYSGSSRVPKTNAEVPGVAPSNGFESLPAGDMRKPLGQDHTDDSNSVASLTSSKSRIHKCYTCTDPEANIASRRLVKCQLCKARYHQFCHTPPIVDISAPFTCAACDKKRIRSASASTSLATSPKSKVRDQFKGNRPLTGRPCSYSDCKSMATTGRHGTRALCKQHEILEKFDKAMLAKSTVPKSPVIRNPIRKKKLYPIPPTDRELLNPPQRKHPLSAHTPLGGQLSSTTANQRPANDSSKECVLPRSVDTATSFRPVTLNNECFDQVSQHTQGPSTKGVDLVPSELYNIIRYGTPNTPRVLDTTGEDAGGSLLEIEAANEGAYREGINKYSCRIAEPYGTLSGRTTDAAQTSTKSFESVPIKGVVESRDKDTTKTYSGVDMAAEDTFRNSTLAGKPYNKISAMDTNNQSQSPSIMSFEALNAAHIDLATVSTLDGTKRSHLHPRHRGLRDLNGQAAPQRFPITEYQPSFVSDDIDIDIDNLFPDPIQGEVLTPGKGCNSEPKELPPHTTDHMPLSFSYQTTSVAQMQEDTALPSSLDIYDLPSDSGDDNVDPITMDLDLVRNEHPSTDVVQPQTTSTDPLLGIPIDVEADIDHYLNLAMQPLAPLSQLTKYEICKSQFFGQVDPRTIYQKEYSPAWYDTKRAEIKARGGRKANWGKVYTAQNRNDRIEKLKKLREQQASQQHDWSSSFDDFGEADIT